MRYFKRLVWAAGVAGVIGFSAAPALAQGGGLGGGGGGLGGGGGGLGGGGLGGGGLGGGGLGGGGLGGGGLGGGGGGLGGGGGGGLGGGSLTGTTLQGMQAAPQITAPGSTGGGGNSAISSSNFLASYYGNPYYQGILSNAQSGAGPGGFGAPLFGANGGAGGGQLGYAGGAAGGAGGARTATGIGGRGGLGGGGYGMGSNNQGVVVQLPVQISYPAISRIPAPPVAAPQLQTDLSGAINRASGLLSNPADVQVTTENVADPNSPDPKNPRTITVVTLRGKVKDVEEARLVEGLVRLTPGVGGLRSELTFPKP
jgi:hypothetical protein